jgi:transcriptional regulator with XRE-family HTH domain
MSTILRTIGEQLQRARHARHLTQADLAVRLGRDRARISEFERDLASNRLGRDRLTLFAEICDALDLVPVIVPRARASEIRGLVEAREGGAARRGPARRAFDDLFVDLDDDEEPG